MAPKQYHITDLCKDLLIACCNYLEEKDIYSFSEVCKYFNIIGINPNSIYHLNLQNDCYALSNIHHSRYNSIKSLNFNGDTLKTIQFKKVWSKHLQYLIIHGTKNNEIINEHTFIHKFENLLSLSLLYLNPNHIFNKIDKYNKYRLLNLELILSSFNLSTLKSVLQCHNLKTLKILLINLNFMEYDIDIQENMIKQQIINASKSESAQFNNLRHIEFDVLSIIPLKPLFYHLLSNTKQNNVTLKIHGYGTPNDQLSISEIFSFDTEYRDTIINIISANKLKSIHFAQSDKTSLSIAKNIGKCMKTVQVLTNNDIDIDIFSIEFESELEYPVNSINFDEDLDIIVSKSKYSKLKIITYYLYSENKQPMIPELSNQFWLFKNENKKCFNEINLEIWGLLRRSLIDAINYYQHNDQQIFNPILWGQNVATNIYTQQLKNWLDLMNDENKVCLKTFGVDTISIHLQLIDKEIMKEEYGWNQIIESAINSLMEQFEVLLNGCDYIEYHSWNQLDVGLKITKLKMHI